MTLMHEQFSRLSEDDQEILLEFLDNITEGEILNICRGQSMTTREARVIIEAHEKFKACPDADE